MRLVARILAVPVLMALFSSAALATVCNPVTVTFGQKPTAAEWNDFLNRSCVILNGLITDGNISPLALIDQDKLESILQNTAFADHDTRHEPGGADEMNDLDIANTGTNVSLHAARHVPGAADPLPVGRLLENVETANQSDSVFAGSVRSKFSSGAVVNKQAVASVHCGGFVYILINDTTATNVDFVNKVSASTLTSSAIISLAGDDDPVDIDCGKDNSVYVLTNGAASRTIKKIDTGNNVTTVVNLNAVTGTTRTKTMWLDPNDTAIYVVGAELGASNDRWIWKVVLPGGTVPFEFSSVDTGDQFGDGFFTVRNGNDRIYMIKRDVDAGDDDCEINEFDTNLNLQTTIAISSGDADCGTDTTTTGSFLFDGSVAILQSSTAATMIDLANQVLIGAVGALGWGGTAPADGANFRFFSGRQFMWQKSDASVILLQPPHYETGAMVNSLDFDGGVVGGGCGISGNGMHFFVCVNKAANTEYLLTKWLID